MLAPFSTPNGRERPPLARAVAAPRRRTKRSPLTRLPREIIEAIIEAALAELDARDGDPDLEPEEDRCVAYDDALHVRLDDDEPGDPEDAEPHHDQEFDPAEHEAWVQPNWMPSAALSSPTPLFPRSAVEALHD